MANTYSPVPRFNASTQYFDAKTPSGLTTAGYQQFAKLQEQQGVAPVVTSAPTQTASTGAFVFEPGTNRLHVFNGVEWKSVVFE